MLYSERSEIQNIAQACRRFSTGKYTEKCCTLLNAIAEQLEDLLRRSEKPPEDAATDTNPPAPPYDASPKYIGPKKPDRSAAAERRGRMQALLDGMEKAGSSALYNASVGYLFNARCDVGDVLASIHALRRYIEEGGNE